MNEPFFLDWDYKTNKVIKFFFLKKQVNEFIRVKIIIILNFHNGKVVSIVFYVKEVNKSLP